MKSFYAEIKTKNTDTIKTYHLLAKSFDEAALIIRAWLAGTHAASYESRELLGLTGKKARGVEAEELL